MTRSKSMSAGSSWGAAGLLLSSGAPVTLSLLNNSIRFCLNSHFSDLVLHFLKVRGNITFNILDYWLRFLLTLRRNSCKKQPSQQNVNLLSSQRHSQPQIWLHLCFACPHSHHVLIMLSPHVKHAWNTILKSGHGVWYIKSDIGSAVFVPPHHSLP